MSLQELFKPEYSTNNTSYFTARALNLCTRQEFRIDRDRRSKLTSRIQNTERTTRMMNGGSSNNNKSSSESPQQDSGTAATAANRNNMLSIRLAELMQANNDSQRNAAVAAIARRASAPDIAAAGPNELGVPDVQALIAALHQQQHNPQQHNQRQQQQRASLLGGIGGTSAALDRDANAQAQALLKHHEDQLRATRLLLEQQQQQQQQGNAGEQQQSQQNPFLLASNAMAAAKAAQTSILNSMTTSGLLMNAGMTAGNASATGGTGSGAFSGGPADERLALLLAEQQQHQDQNYIHSLLAANAGSGGAHNSTLALANLADEEVNRKRRATGDNRSEEEAMALGSHGNVAMAAAAGGGNLDGDSDDDHPEGDDDDEGYDDNLTDEEYFKNFSANDDNRVIQETFPLKLYRMLFEVEKEGHENIVSFLPHGKSFVVHKPKAFVEVCTCVYFGCLVELQHLHFPAIYVAHNFYSLPTITTFCVLGCHAQILYNMPPGFVST